MRDRDGDIDRAEHVCVCVYAVLQLTVEMPFVARMRNDRKTVLCDDSLCSVSLSFGAMLGECVCVCVRLCVARSVYKRRYWRAHTHAHSHTFLIYWLRCDIWLCAAPVPLNVSESKHITIATIACICSGSSRRIGIGFKSISISMMPPIRPGCMCAYVCVRISS